MSAGARRPGVRTPVLLAGFAILAVAHHDVPLWDESRLVLGLLPPSLLYHVVYCLVAAAALTLLVRRAWPAELDDAAADDGER